MDLLSITLAALADPTRRAILGRLVQGPAPAGDLARPFPMSQQAVSKHLATLERAKLVEKRKDGRLQICTLNPRPLQGVAEWTERYRALWEGSFHRLDALLDELKTARRARGRTKRKKTARTKR